MPSASDRGKSGKTDKKLGGSKTASNETPVSSKENPDPANSKTGNTGSTRPAAQTQGAKGPSTKSGAKAGDHTEATGRDHPQPERTRQGAVPEAARHVRPEEQGRTAGRHRGRL